MVNRLFILFLSPKAQTWQGKHLIVGLLQVETGKGRCWFGNEAISNTGDAAGLGLPPNPSQHRLFQGIQSGS